MKNKSIWGFSIFLVVFIFGLSLAMANDSNSTISNSKNWSSVCGKINDLVSEKINAFDGDNIKRINALNNTENTLQDLMNKLSAKGINVTQSQTDYQDFQLKVNQFNQDYSAFVTKLEGLKSFTCGNSSGMYASQLNDAKSMLPILRNESALARETAMKVKGDLVKSRGDFLSEKLGQKVAQLENRTTVMNARLQNRTNQLNNRMTNISARMQNRGNYSYNRSMPSASNQNG